MSDLTEFITERRALSGFESVYFKTFGELYLTQGDEFMVEVSSSDEKVLDSLRTKVKKNRLIISMGTGAFRWLFSPPIIEIKVVMPRLEKLASSGSGSVFSEDAPVKARDLVINSSGTGLISLNVDAHSIKVNLSGTGGFELKGQTKNLNISHSGIGRCDAIEMEAESVRLDANGIGECSVYATHNLRVRSGGIGKIRFRGNPEIDKRMHGMGALERVRE